MENQAKNAATTVVVTPKALPTPSFVWFLEVSKWLSDTKAYIKWECQDA